MESTDVPVWFPGLWLNFIVKGKMRCAVSGSWCWCDDLPSKKCRYILEWDYFLSFKIHSTISNKYSICKAQIPSAVFKINEENLIQFQWEMRPVSTHFRSFVGETRFVKRKFDCSNRPKKIVHRKVNQRFPQFFPFPLQRPFSFELITQCSGMVINKR